MTPGEAFNGLVQRGLPTHVALGIVRNLEDESGLNPGINEAAPMVPGSRGGFGLAQWTGPRRNALENYAASRGMPVSDGNLQLDFLMEELQGPENNAFRSVMATGDEGAAAAAFAKDFLRPASQHLNRRVAEYTGSSYAMPEGGNALAGYGGLDPNTLNALVALSEPQKPQEPQFRMQAPALSLNPTLNTSFFG